MIATSTSSSTVRDSGLPDSNWAMSRPSSRLAQHEVVEPTNHIATVTDRVVAHARPPARDRKCGVDCVFTS